MIPGSRVRPFPGLQRSLHPPGPRRGVLAREMDPVFRAGDVRHECTHLARFEHGKRTARPGIQGPSLDEALLELRSDGGKRVGDQSDAEREAVLSRLVEDGTAHRPADRRAKDAAAAPRLIVGRVPYLGRTIGPGDLFKPADRCSGCAVNARNRVLHSRTAAGWRALFGREDAGGSRRRAVVNGTAKMMRLAVTLRSGHSAELTRKRNVGPRPRAAPPPRA